MYTLISFTIAILSLALAMTATDILMPYDAIKSIIQYTETYFINAGYLPETMATAGRYMLVTAIALKIMLTIALWLGVTGFTAVLFEKAMKSP